MFPFETNERDLIISGSPSRSFSFCLEDLLFSCSVMSDSLQPHELQHSGFPVLHYLLEFAQTRVHQVSDAIQPSHPLWSSSPAISLSQHQKESESEVAQLCLTLCNPMDCRPPCSSICGIFQARILEWVAIFFSRGSF